MGLYDKYKGRQDGLSYGKSGSGWPQESERHSLAAQGIKTGAKKTGLFLGRSLKSTAGLVGDGLLGNPSEIQEQDEEIQEDLNTQNPFADTEKTLKEADDNTWETSSYEYEPEEDKDKKDIEKMRPFSELEKPKSAETESTEREIKELNDEMHTEDWRHKSKEKITKIMGAIKQFYFSNDHERMDTEIGKLEGEKLAYKDKIQMLNQLRKNVLSKKFSDETQIEDQFKYLEKVDRNIGVLLNDVNSLDYKIREVRMSHQKLKRNEMNKEPEKRYSIFPSLGEVFGGPLK